MSKLRKKYICIALVLLVAMAPLVWLFHYAYEPVLVLREQQQLEKMDPEVTEQLLTFTLDDRFDLADTLEFVRMLLRDGRSDDAVQVFQILHARYADVPGIVFWYAESLRENHLWEEAENVYLDIAARMESFWQQNEGVDFTRARDRDLVMMNRRTGLPVSLISVDPSNLYRHLGENALSAGMDTEDETERDSWFARSEGYFNYALSLNPDANDVRGAYANLLLQMKRPEESLAEYVTLLELEPENTGWLESAANAAAAGQNFEAAALHTRAALNVEERVEWRLKLARYLSWDKEHSAALLEIDSLISDYPNNREFLLEWYQFLLNAQKYDEFLRATDRLASLFPEEYPIRVERIRILMSMNRYEEASNEAASILALDPEQVEVALLRGEAYLWMKQYGSAQEALLKLEERNPVPLVQKRLAQSYLWDEKPNQALIWFRMLDPASMQDPEVVHGYAEALSQQAQISEEELNSVLIIHTYLEQNPDQTWPPTMLAAMSRVLTRSGDPEKAVGLLQSVVATLPDDLNLRMELADLLHAQGRFEEADELYQSILYTTSNETVL